MIHRFHTITSLVFSATLLLSSAVNANPTYNCQYRLAAAENGSSARVNIMGEMLNIKVRRAKPDTLYTVWIDFRNRATLTIPDDYPSGAIARGVAPAFASTAGVTAGMGMDENGFMTDGNGNANFYVKLDYEVLKTGASPVVAADLTMQGENRVAGAWMRSYAVDPDTAASVQVIDSATHLPVVEKSTAQGLTIVGHFDNITHGHTPGVGNVDHFPGFNGDFPDRCKM